MNNKQGWFSVHFYPLFHESGFIQQKREYFMSSSWEYRSRAKMVLWKSTMRMYPNDGLR